MNGILLIDKPSGWTSFDVVNYVRKMVAIAEGKKPKNVKVGHTGTLDPLATGLLVLLIGNYTKRALELSKLDKTYEVAMRLGQTSTTGDREGDITEISDTKPEHTDIEDVLQKFTGEIMQTPPAYSAVKVNGQRAYKLARAGKSVDIEPRKVTIHQIELKKYEYPAAEFMAAVSSGTYIRTLVEDIGKELGTGAYMTDLRRVNVGQFSINNAESPKTTDLLHNVFEI
ncbi:MAG TPA: tRNA pseudouridine(55) synthase TruB [Candidatus Saccharimonadales bacterium]|nr:tRNA pseudouridine(55) synthase TruB [Candidatus Saccharimonadales bacterium]